MELNALLNSLAEKKFFGDTHNNDITGIVYDPLRVKPGNLYVAINIYTQLDKVELPDGHPFVYDAIKNGATAVILQQDMEIPSHICKILVPNSRYALSVVSSQFYGHPSKSLKMFGITGTNGKTTTTHIIESIFGQKYVTGLIGTLYYKINGVIHESKDTTPEPSDLHAIFRDMVDQKVQCCVMEVSSHGIDFNRVNGVIFDAAVFTNLSQDHLDYHKTMENYMQTKLRLFKSLSKEQYGIMNVDNSYSKEFLDAVPGNLYTFGLSEKADITAKNIQYSLNDTKYLLSTPIGNIEICSKLLGQFNVYNSLAAVGVALSQELDLEIIKIGLEQPIRVAGRFERIEKGQNFSVVVDYAHTPLSMESVLKLTKSLNPNRIITVFGCGGDRDPRKRPLMGEAAAKYSDVVIVTSDNPRNEDPEQILDHIIQGIPSSAYKKFVDRSEAIRYGVQIAEKNDILLILGKGHETIQILKGRTIEFNDRIEAEKALESAGYIA